jgi:hypothetical protein
MAAGALSILTLVLALIWLTIGVCAIGHCALNDFPNVDIPRRWLRGPRRGCLWFYHLAWWPRYTPMNLRVFTGRTSKTGKAGR